METIIKLNETLEVAKKVSEMNKMIDDNNQKIYIINHGPRKVSVLAIILMLVSLMVSGIFLYDTDGGSLLIGLIIFIIAVVIMIKCNNKDYENRRESVRQITEENNIIKNNIENVIVSNQDVVKYVPADYFYPVAIEYFISVIKSGRANNMAMAMNLYEEQLYRWKMESMARNTMIANQQAVKNLESIKRVNTVNTAVNSVNAAANVARAVSRIMR